MRLSYIVTMNGERAGRQLQLFGLYLYMDTTDTSSMLLHMLSPCIDYALWGIVSFHSLCLVASHYNGLLVHATRLLHMIQENLVPSFKREGKKKLNNDVLSSH